MRNIIVGIFTLTLSSLVMATPIIYSVDRTIGSGTVVGSLETDGTIGVLGASNILSWDLMLTSANLSGGSDHITGSSSIIVGSSLIASLTDLFFDFSSIGAGFAVQGTSGNAWCMATAGISCIGEATPSESIVYSVNGGPAETEARSGRISIASANSVPEPSTLALMGLALAGLALSRSNSKK